jgi:hypothetical protein
VNSILQETADTKRELSYIITIFHLSLSSAELQIKWMYLHNEELEDSEAILMPLHNKGTYFRNSLHL